MSSEFLTLYHATNLDAVYEVRPQDDFATVSKLSELFDGWMAKFSLEEQAHNIEKQHSIYTCDIKRDRIARKKDLVRNEEALKIICDETGMDDLNYADMLADLVFESPDNQDYTYEDVMFGLSLKMPDRVPEEPHKKREMELRFARYEVMRLLGQVARNQGFDAISIFRAGSKDVLVVNPKINWIKH